MTKPEPGRGHPTSPQDEQPVELYPPVDDDGWHASQVRDWVAVSPELSDSAIRLYLIMRALVIEKRGPVRKLTLWELCHLLPSKPVEPGEQTSPSSVSRIRGLLRQLTVIGLVTTPEGRRLTTSSRALAAGRGLRIRINLMPTTAYTGPRNVFDVLDDVREAAEQSARKARGRELELAAKKRAERAAEKAGQISDPHPPGQKSDPLGQIFNPLGQISDPDSASGLQDREPPLSLSAQSFRSDAPPTSVRPSVQVETAHETRTDGRGGGIERDPEGMPVPAGGGAKGGGVTGDATPTEAKTATKTGGAAAGGLVRVDASPGVELLLAIGAERSELLLTGRTLRDQGLMVTGLLAGGWPVSLLRELIMRPLPDPLRRTVGAVISVRLKAAASMPVPRPVAGVPVPHQAAALERSTLGEERRWEDGPTPMPARWEDRQEEHEQLRRGIDRTPTCEADDGLCPTLAVVGETQCAAHLGWPMCPGYGEYTCTRRTRDGEQCTSCQDQGFHARLAEVLPLDETEDGTCPGYTGSCGRRALPSDRFCARCRIASQRDRDRIKEEWEATLKTAVTAAKTQEIQEATPAPF